MVQIDDAGVEAEGGRTYGMVMAGKVGNVMAGK